MAYIAWDNQIFCTPDDVAAKAPLSGLVPGSNLIQQNEFIQNAITTGKERLKRIVMQQCERAFPQTKAALITMQNGQVKDSISQFNSQIRALGGSNYNNWNGNSSNWNFLFAFGGVWFDNWVGSWGNVRPRIFWESGTHSTTVYAGTADRGDFMGNAISGFIYVNFADNPSVDWQTFRPDNLIDYIANPTCLKDANVYAAIEAALENSALTQTSRDVVEKNLGLLDSHFVKKVKSVIGECMQNVTFGVANVTDLPPYDENAFNKSSFVAIG